MAILLREAIGDELRRVRKDQGRTLREVSTSARVSLGYLSEVERGQKEASSELLASICEALDVPIGQVLVNVGGQLTPPVMEVVPAPEPLAAETLGASTGEKAALVAA
ncbi:MAG: helix-turn-helix transcriptional regulator [Gordonia sp. (in: high G+C Gram-positive bacteria)]